jgi:hypothetical protein
MGKKSKQILEKQLSRRRSEIKTLSCVFFVTLCPSLHRLHIFSLSLPNDGSTYHFFFAVFMFYAAIKTTREQHNIIRYVLKILTKKQNLTPCCENHIGSPHADRALFSPPLRFFRRFLISTFAIQIRNMLFFVGLQMHRCPSF